MDGELCEHRRNHESVCDALSEPIDHLRRYHVAVDDDYDLRQWRTHDKGGHFGPWEAPDVIVTDARDFFRPLR